MARITRKELKTDKFALEVEHTVDFFEKHRQEIIRYGAVALVLVLIGIAFSFYQRQQRAARQEALAQAILVQEAPVGNAPPGAPITFPTQEAKEKEALRVFSNLASKYPGTDEGLVAEYYLGCIASDQGKPAEAEKHYKQVADSGNKRYSSLAKLSLAQIYFLQGHADQGEKLLRDLIAHPSIFVSKEQATVVLARELARSKPNEARKLLEPLRTSRSSAVSQVAIQLYSELPPQ